MRRPAYGIGDSEIWSDRRQVHKSHGLNGNMPSLSYIEFANTDAFGIT